MLASVFVLDMAAVNYLFIFNLYMQQYIIAKMYKSKKLSVKRDLKIDIVFGNHYSYKKRAKKTLKCFKFL